MELYPSHCHALLPLSHSDACTRIYFAFLLSFCLPLVWFSPLSPLSLSSPLPHISTSFSIPSLPSSYHPSVPGTWTPCHLLISSFVVSPPSHPACPPNLPPFFVHIFPIKPVSSLPSSLRSHLPSSYKPPVFVPSLAGSSYIARSVKFWELQ